MVSMRHLIFLLEKVGMGNSHTFHSKWQDHAQKVYVWVQGWIVVVRLLCQLYNTVTRAVRYRPELIQTLVEESTMSLYVYVVFFYNKQYTQLNRVSDFIHHKFSTANKRVVQRVHRLSNIICLVFVSIVAVVIISSILETMIPMPETELRIRQQVYRTQYPERRLPYNMRIPGLDESQSWGYELLYGVDILVLIFFICRVSLLVILFPTVVIHLQGQYEMLCHYICMLGESHRDALGNRIAYTNIETNDYEVLSEEPGIRRNKLKQLTNKLTRQMCYEMNYLRQIIRFHTKLITFQQEFIKGIRPFIMGLIFANNVIISLCLYEMVVVPTKLSPLRYFKFIGQLLSFMMEYYFFCNCSEMMDNCHGMIRKAINDSGWEKCTTRTRRDLCMLLRRVQRPNHMRFHNGAIVLSRIFFLKVVKVAYTFVNFVR